MEHGDCESPLPDATSGRHPMWAAGANGNMPALHAARSGFDSPAVHHLGGDVMVDPVYPGPLALVAPSSSGLG